jgi:dipeptidyl aminopeptidase/acylaminoacyl peptidase
MLLMGHSYGAFGALSLLATTDHFSGAIARSGAYNRSLTPIGFQSEKRPLWEIPDLYQQLSPFFQANQIAAPILLIHGTEDQNPGTSVLQSELMFQALQSNGIDTELLLLPHEGHEYETRDNILAMLHTQAHWIRQRINEQKTMKPHL